jgi:hypothetical protein
MTDNAADPATKLQSISPSSSPEDKRAAIEAIANVDDEIARSDLITTLKDRAKIEKRLIARIVEEIRSKPEEEPFTFTEGERVEALDLLQSKDMLTIFLADCAEYYQGREDVLLLGKLCATSRHFDQSVSWFTTGPTSVGKSALVEVILDSINPDDVIPFTRFSTQYLAYHTGDLRNKIVSVFEMQGLPDEQTMIRTAITEGRILVGVVDKGTNGELRATRKAKDTRGITFIATTAHYNIEEQLRTRVLISDLEPDSKLAA